MDSNLRSLHRRNASYSPALLRPNLQAAATSRVGTIQRRPRSAQLLTFARSIEQKAPLYSHFLETMSGLPTVRAFGWTSQYADKALLLLDSAQKPSYLLSCIQRWLTLVLDLVVAALIVLLVALAVLLREKNTVDPSLLGVALVNMMYLGINLKNIVLQWSTLETSLGAVSRVKAFTENTPSENSASETGILPPGWPVRGSLVVRDLTIQYE